LAQHVLLGDELGFMSPSGKVRWLSASPVSQSPSAHVVLMQYEGDGAAMAFCVAASGEARTLIGNARAATTAAAAARKWGPLLGRFSYLTDPVAARTDVSSLDHGRFTRVRRAAHADPLIDCFLVRDRMCEMARLEQALGLVQAEAEPGCLHYAS
jgi:hypothetical protein